MSEQSPTNQLGKYELQSRLGVGAFATVYRAQDITLERAVALKVLHPPLLADPIFIERFKREATTMARLNHPHITTIYEVGEAAGQVFIAMELASGKSLAQQLIDQGPYPVAEALTLLQPICQAIDYAYRQGIIHRDLKPANIMLDVDRGPLLTDFGFARLVSLNSVSLTLSGGIVGTPPYVAPEVWESDAGHPPADLYALGCIVYEMLTGTILFDGPTPMQVMRAHDQGPNFDPEEMDTLLAGLDKVLRKAVAQQPENRYQTAEILYQALLQLQTAATVAAEAKQQAAQQAALAAQWQAETEAAMTAGDWRLARMAVGRWLAVTPDDPAALAARTEIERKSKPRQIQPTPPPTGLPSPTETTSPKRPMQAPVSRPAPKQETVFKPLPDNAPPVTSRKRSGWLVGTAGCVLGLLVIFVGALIVWGIAAGSQTYPTPAPEQPAAEEPAAPTEAPMAEEPAMEEALLNAPPGGFLERAMNGEFWGTTVTVDGPFVDTDKVKFNESMTAFENATGIDVQYIGSRGFEALISVRVDAGDAPDIADFFPQPGLLGSFVRTGKVVDPTNFISQDWLQQQYNQSWLDMSMMEGPDGGKQSAGVWHRYVAKSLVWYPKDEWDAAGYQIPETWDELMALSQQIADDGDTAWCIGIESGAATGWAATDWTEELMLRTTSLDNYDAWTAGQLPFESREVKNAIETWSEIWFTDYYVLGGTESIVTTFFGDAPTPMFDSPPNCWMHRQGNFIIYFFPEGVEYGTDYSFFYLPPVDERYGRPMLVAGDIMAMFNDRPEVRALMEYMTTAASMSGYMKDGGALSPHTDARIEDYGNPLERDIAAIAETATTFRFDASDQMPGEVGAGSFWKGMTDYVSGSTDLDTVLAEIDASWPR